MKKILFILFMAVSTLSMAQETATVFFARKGLWTGTAGRVKIFMDDKIVCELSNDSYSVHVVPVGLHAFHAQWYSKSSKKKSIEENVTVIELKSGHEYYLQSVKQKYDLIMQEITANTWKKTKEGLKEDDCH
ncbi:MAG: hypothetical protein ACRC1W_01220 [Shewanella sp.]